jgi:hypothetical protein
MFEEIAQAQPPADVVVAQAVDEPAANQADPKPRGRKRVRGERVLAPAEEFTPSIPPLSYPQFVPDRSTVGALPGKIDYPLPAGASTEAALGGFLPGPGEGMPNRSGPVVASTIMVILGWAAHSVIAWRRRPHYQPA